MKKVYFLFLLCCSSLVALSQGTTVVTIFATGTAGTAITASSTTTVRTEGNIVTNSTTERGYAVFDLSTLPAGVSITACTLGIDVTGLAGGGAVGGWSTHGVAGSLAGVTVPATLYADMDGGTVVSAASYGAAVGENTVAFTAAGNTFMTAQVGTLVSICLTGGTRTYTITGEAGTATTTGVHAPYLTITYCTPPSAVTATATPTALCIGNTLTLTGAATGATSFAWAGPGGFAAAVESTTSVVTAASTGIYTLTATNTCGAVTSSTIATTASVTANSVPAPIAGGVNVCTGHTLALTDATTGGTWSISPAGIATLSATGTLSGVAAGSAVVTYSLGTGCTDTETINDFTPPAAITGGATVICTGSTLTLNETTTGGVWTSTNTGVATVSAAGVVSAIAGGSSVISYTLPSGCFSSVNLIINPATAPDPITGVTTECVGSNVTLTDASGGGNWSSSAPGTSQIYPTGVAYGINAGVATITYTSAATGCFVTSTMTVVAAPAAITGTAGACVGSNTTLTETTTGGVWSSANTAIATVDSVSGAVTGVALGSVTISYTVPPGCSSTDNITVHPLPSAIAGSAVVCTGSTTTLTNTTVGGGTWSSSNTAIATVGLTTGIVSGVAAGGATITFTTTAGCTATQVINDADPPPAITGDTASICAGNPLTLNDATAGGTWTSGNTAVATNAGAVITGVAAGSSTISYTLANTCSATAIVTVDPLPVAIAGNGVVCTGSTITLTDATSGGKWTSSAPAIATIDSVAGSATGLLAGATTITYTVGTGCFVTFALIDADTPAAITGGGVLACAGTPVTLGETTTGGTWTSSNAVIATVGSATGTVTGASSGADTIIYTLTSGCFAETTITVNPLPEVINGGTLICTGNTITLTDTATGGTWSSSLTTVATINSTTGAVTGVTAGSATITYTLTTGCSITSTITDSDPPGAITTTVTEICQGSATTFTNTTAGGTWSSSNTGVATIDSNAGTITGTGGGTATISYIMPTSCVVTAVITVDPLPAAIAGSAFVCTGNTTLLTDATSGGTWATSVSTVASIDPTGTVYGIAGGTSTISYTLATGCYDTLVVTDNDPPGAIAGTAVVCVLSTTQLSNGLTGGTWSSTDMTVATVDNTGLVTGVGEGVATISYIMPTTCFVTVQVTVNPLPAAIVGATSICTGGTTLLTTTNTDGGWSTSNPAAASIDGTGTVYGIAAGTATISYTITATGCFVTSPMTDTDPPGGVTGPTAVCQLASVNLTETSGGGTWVSSEPAIATVDPTGAVTGVNAGTVTISYILSTGCFSTESMTVNPIPAAITGAAIVCTGDTITLADANTDGTWSTSAAGIASVNAASGAVYGMGAGTANISYIITATGCFVTAPMQDNDPPTPIVGSSPICVGSTVTFTDAVGGGLWSSQMPLIASANGITGDIFGSAPGADTISYTIPACAAATFAVTVNPAPTPIAGPDMVCVGSSIGLSDATTGGFWSSGNPGFATVDTNGNVFGQNAGILSVDYTTGGCTPASITITVNPTPTAIAGLTQVCATFTTTLTDGVSGGIWTSSTPAVASIDPLSGTVLGVNQGTAMITYTLPAGCSKSLSFTVNPLPAPITFPTAVVCVGSVITFSEDSTGGMWSSGSTAVATVGTGAGIISGVGAGVTNIIYTLPTGCLAFAPVTVNPLPIASAGPSTVCVGGTTTLINSSPGGPGNWSSSNTSLATVGLVSGVVTGVAVGTVTIIYSLPTGCNTSNLITVNPVPAAIFGLSSVCAGSSITLTDVTPGGTWNTTSGAASVVLGTGVVNGLSAGVADISYTLTATGCAATSLVTVDPLPAAISGPTVICQNATLTLTDTDPGGTWSSTNTAIATVGLTSGIVTGVGTGAATIIYSFPTGCLTGSAITTEPTPVAVITPGGPTTFCAGGNVVLSATGGVYTYQWYDSSVAISGAIGATYNALTTGSYTVKITSSFGCSDSSAATGVTNGIFPVLDYTGSPSLCVGKNLLLTVDPGAAVGFITYEWEDNGVIIPGAADVTYDATAGGSYSSVVSITGTSGTCTVNSDTVTIILHPLPVPVVSFDGATLSTPNIYTSYQWFLNTVGIPGANASTYVPVINGSYRVLVVDSFGCDGYSAATLVSTTGVKHITRADVKIYPNPATSIVHIESPASVRAVITSVEGKTVLEQENAKDINISTLANGLYLIMIYDENGDQIVVEKLIKE